MKEIFKLAAEITVEGLKQAQKDISNFEQSSKKAIAPLIRFGREAENIGKQFTKAITFPIVAGSAAVTKFAGDFEKSMVTSTAIMGNVSKEMQGVMAETAKKISKESTFGASELAKSYYYLASAGYDAEQSIAALGKVAKFAEAGQFDLQIATDLLTDAQSALGLATKDATENEKQLTRVSDVLVKANTLANASVQQFSEALTNKSGAALRSVGKDVEEGTAVLAAYADQGTKGAEAGTQLSIVLRDLQTAALNNGAEFKKQNVAVYDSTGEMRNFADILGDVENALEGKSDADKKATLSALGFADKSMSSLLTLVGTSEKIRQYEKDLRAAGGTTEEVSEKQLKNFNDQLKILYNRLQVAAINLGNVLLPVLKDKVLPAVEGLLNKLELVVEWFANIPAPIQNVILAVTGFITVMGPALIGLGKFLSLAKLLPATLGAVKLAMATLNGVMMANPIIAVVGAVVALGVALYSLNKAYKTVNKTIDENRRKFKDDAEAKQLQMKKGLLEEITYHYEKLAYMDVSPISNEEFKASKTAADNLERSLADLGVTLEGGYLKRLTTVEQELDNLNYTTEENTDTTEEQIDALKELSSGLYTTAQETENLADEEKKLSEQRLKDNATFDKMKKDAAKYEQGLKDAELEDQKEMNDKYRELTASSVDERIQLLIEARNEELLNADMVGADKLRIEKYYSGKIQEIRDDEKEREEKAFDDRINNVQSWAQKGIQTLSGYYQIRQNLLEGDYQKEKERIEKSTMDEEAKTAALEKLDSEYTNKKREFAKKQAMIEKAGAIFSIGVNTATAIVKALPNIVLSSIIGAMGAVQAAIVASKPIPAMAQGGIIKATSGGTLVQAAEAGEDEAFIPMTKGTASIAGAIMDNMKKISGGAGAGSNSFAAAGTTPINFHIGTFIGDDKGIKELTRRIIPYITSENRRRGVVV